MIQIDIRPTIHYFLNLSAAAYGTNNINLCTASVIRGSSYNTPESSKRRPKRGSDGSCHPVWMPLNQEEE